MVKNRTQALSLRGKPLYQTTVQTRYLNLSCLCSAPTAGKGMQWCAARTGIVPELMKRRQTTTATQTKVSLPYGGSLPEQAHKGWGSWQSTPIGGCSKPPLRYRVTAANWSFWCKQHLAHKTRRHLAHIKRARRTNIRDLSEPAERRLADPSS